MPVLKELLSSKCFGGYQKIISHQSQVLNCDMKFGIYIPPCATSSCRVPVLYWLSGLKSTEENFMQKAGAQRFASENGLCLVNPDTSPRNVDLPGQDDNDFIGAGASFYIDATEDPWKKHYHMFTYVTNELIQVIEKYYPVLTDRRSIFGFSMGGHGALICVLKKPELYQSVSVLAPCSNVLKARYTNVVFPAYLGQDKSKWKEYDATELAATYNGTPLEILFDQGSDDEYLLKQQLLPENFIGTAINNERIKINFKMRDGYDHTYYYVSTFIEDHMRTWTRLIGKEFTSMCNMGDMKEVLSSKSFGGVQKIISHKSKLLGCEMKFAIYLPSGADLSNPVPVLYWLCGLQCTEENFIQKAGAQRYASEHNLCIVGPDSSPRNVEIPGHDDFDYIGSGASFYIDSTEEPWKKHYQMFSYVTNELIQVVESNFPVCTDRRSISGFSMGGHGSLICALKKPQLYRSISAFSPVANLLKTEWADKIFSGYLGSNESKWKEYDATELARIYKGPPLEIFIEQGTDDEYLTNNQLLPENFIKNAINNDLIDVIFKTRSGYNHSHYYIATFIEEHIKYHMKFLKQ